MCKPVNTNKKSNFLQSDACMLFRVRIKFSVWLASGYIHVFVLVSVIINDTFYGSVTITIETGRDGATTLSRMNFSGYVGHVFIFN